MGRKDKRYHKDLKQQMFDVLTAMLHAGEGTSKRKAILDGTEKDKIFSYNTYKTYWQHCKYFANYIRKNHPECTTLKASRKYVNEWLQHRADEVKIVKKKNFVTGVIEDKEVPRLSAWTIHTEAKALGKLYNIQPDANDYFTAPKRRRQDIKRSRLDVVGDKYFSETNNADFIKFCLGTGCRRNVIMKLKGQDLWSREDIKKEILRLNDSKCINAVERKTLIALEDAICIFPDITYFIHDRSDKGGRERFSPIIGCDVEKIVRKMRSVQPHEKVWQYVPKHADIHGYRAEYATQIYKMYARPIENIPYDRMHCGIKRRYQSEVYVCRKDALGKRLDRAAAFKASKALGHNRVEVVANNYIRGI